MRVVLLAFIPSLPKERYAVAQERILEFLLSARDVPWDAGEGSKEAARV